MTEKCLHCTQHIPNLTAGKWNIHSALESQAHLRVVFEKNEITLAGFSPQEVLAIGEKRMVKLLWPQVSSPC
jgi:hypothetical protein